MASMSMATVAVATVQNGLTFNPEQIKTTREVTQYTVQLPMQHSQSSVSLVDTVFGVGYCARSLERHLISAGAVTHTRRVLRQDIPWKTRSACRTCGYSFNSSRNPTLELPTAGEPRCTHLGPFFGGQSLWRFHGDDARASPFYISTVVPPDAVIEEQHLVVGDPRIFVQLFEMPTLVVGVYLPVLHDFVHHQPRGHLCTYKIRALKDGWYGMCREALSWRQDDEADSQLTLSCGSTWRVARHTEIIHTGHGRTGGAARLAHHTYPTYISRRDTLKL